MSLRTILAFIAGALVTTTAQGAIVDGHCYLEGQTNHCLTVVEITDGITPHLAYTDSTGYFSMEVVNPGYMYTFRFSHPCFETRTQQFYVPVGGVTLPDITLESNLLCDPATWRFYPYTLPGDPPIPIIMPYDEGKHDPTSTYHVEWWYVNFHFTTEDGTPYAGIVSFFKPPIIGLPGMVLFTVIDLQTGFTYADAKYPLITDMNDQWFDIAFGAPPQDDWWNRECESKLMPFEYHLSVSWADEGVNWLELDMAACKPPLPVGGDGFVEFDDIGWSYYYSHPHTCVIGTLHLQGFPALGKHVEGKAWIDHQWADFPTEIIRWEWLSIQLDDDREIMVADVFSDGAPLGSFSGGLNLYDEDCSLHVLPDYKITPLAHWYDAVTGRTFATAWRVEEPSWQINLTVTADYQDQMMRTTGDILPSGFWEGACTVSGTIGGQPVTGTAFAELTHSLIPEACCLDDESCQEMYADECIAQGGIWMGWGTECAGMDCVRQACCDDDGNCEDWPPDYCVGYWRTPLGPGTVCEDGCLEACCFDDGTCQDLYADDCLAQGGTPKGLGTKCLGDGDGNGVDDACECTCCPGGPFGDGSDGDVVIDHNTQLARDMDYHNLTVLPGVTLDTRGHTVWVCGTLENNGTITDTYCGGHGGNAGSGGWGGDPCDSPSGNPKPDQCTPGTCGSAGGQARCTGGGQGGDGGDGGGGGGGAMWPQLSCDADADGGNGGDGGASGDGGGVVRIYVFNLDNSGGIIHADGEDGQPGSDGEDGECFTWALKDLGGGGGGGGCGGDGGDGGTVEIHYGSLTTYGTIRAHGGDGGGRGYGGDGCNLSYATSLGRKQYGCSGCGCGGDGGDGEYDATYSEDGENGGTGSNGVNGTVSVTELLFNDCNANGCPDQCDLFNCPPDVAWCDDCQPNGVLDVCDILNCLPGDPDCDDCNGNGVPDGCDIDDCLPGDPGCADCQPNGVPDWCDIEYCPPGDPDCDDCQPAGQPGHGIPDSCDIRDCLPGDPDCDDCNGNGVPDWCDIHWGASLDCNDNSIPDECEPAFTDVSLFVGQLLAHSQDPVLVCMFDQNDDGVLDGRDIQVFVDRVLASP
ncbi:MAG: hypothetical protein JXQ75_15110 [Phycisphaerae bacterium]|nr:hypothetical protein [Phycisphaerae bacterium]